MELFPAIDVRDGRCVRLLQGDYARETVYHEDPVEVAGQFIEAGARWIHIVDLDAARGDGPKNRAVVGRVAALAGQHQVSVQTGGGVRSVEDAAALFDVGITRVVVGTAAVRNPDVVAAMTGLGIGSVAVGLDVHLSGGDADRSFTVAVEGWTQSSGTSMFEVLDRLKNSGASAVVATDISRDGMLVGPSLELYVALRACGLGVIASGGVSSLDDLRALRELGFLEGAIAGKAIYEKRFDVVTGVAICRGLSS